MTVYSDWRTGPPPHNCTGCGAALTACEGRQMLSGRSCCTGCNHAEVEGITS